RQRDHVERAARVTPRGKPWTRSGSIRHTMHIRSIPPICTPTGSTPRSRTPVAEDSMLAQFTRLATIASLVLAGTAMAAEIRVQCYSDGNECEVTQDLAKRFETKNPGTKVVVDKVPYKAVVETLPVQLAAGEGPDIARVTDLGGLSKFYLDLTPYLGAR